MYDRNMSCLLYEFCVLVVIILTQFESCLQANGRTPTTDRPRRKTSPYTAYKLTSIRGPRGIKPAIPVLERSKLSYTVLTPKLIWNRHVRRVRKESFLNFRALQNQSSLHLHYTWDEEPLRTTTAHQDYLHKDSRSQTWTLPCGFCLPLFPLQYQELTNYTYRHEKLCLWRT